MARTVGIGLQDFEKMIKRNVSGHIIEFFKYKRNILSDSDDTDIREPLYHYIQPGKWVWKI